MSNPKIYIEGDSIVIELPLTTPKGKIRVKRRINNFGYSIATRSTPFQENDYVEWQISYASNEGNLNFIKFPNGKLGYELAEIMCYAKKSGILDQKEFTKLLEFVEDVEQTIEESERLTRFPTEIEIHGFKRFEEKIPVFVKNCKDYFVEIALRHKQKAIGYQSMVFLCIWIKNLESEESLIGRTANIREFAKFRITKDNKEIIEDVVKAFAIASEQHNNDMKVLLKEVLEKC